MGPCFKSYLSYKFDRPEMIHDRAKMNLVSHWSGDCLEIISSPDAKDWRDLKKNKNLGVLAP